MQTKPFPSMPNVRNLVAGQVAMWRNQKNEPVWAEEETLSVEYRDDEPESVVLNKLRERESRFVNRARIDAGEDSEIFITVRGEWSTVKGERGVNIAFLNASVLAVPKGTQLTP